MTRYIFDGFAVDTDRHEVIGPDGARSFEPQVFDVIRHLLEADGRLVAKNDLLDAVWGHRFVTESAMTTQIKNARRLLDDNGQAQRTIRTVRGRGYQFVADVAIEPGATDWRSSSDAAGRLAPPARRAAASAIPAALRAASLTPLVGRDDELGQMTSFSSSRSDALAWIWLLGEPGIGKTRLASQYALEMSDAGARVLFGRCDEDLMVPYQPVIEALRAVTAPLVGTELRAALGHGVDQLTPLIPDLHERLGERTPAEPPSTDAETGRFRLHQAIGEWLGEMARHGPVVFVIDDVHWATEATLQLLGQLQGDEVPGHVTIVATARDTAPHEHPRIADLISRSSGDQLIVRLGGLGPDAVASLADESTSLAVDAILRETAGNPLLVRALVGDPGHEDGLASAVRRRTAGLPERAQDVLTVASVIGLQFDLPVVGHVLERAELDVLDDLELAVAARLLVEIDLDRFQFLHALVRGVLRDDLSAGRRARLHGRIADALMAVHGDALGDVRATIAHHQAAASVVEPGRRPGAIEHLRFAARSAASTFSFDTAIAHLRAARSLVASTDRRLRSLLALEQGDAEARAGYSEPALRSFDAAFADARAVGDADLVVRAALSYEDVSWRPGRHGGPAADRLVAARAMVAETDRRAVARIELSLCRAHSHSLDRRSAEVAQERAEALVAGIDDVSIETTLLTIKLGPMYGHAGSGSQADADRLVELLPLVDDTDQAMLAFQVLQSRRFRMGEFEVFRQGHIQMEDRAAALRSTFWDYVVANMAAMLSLYDGDFDRTEHLTERCLEIADGLPDEDNAGTYGLRMFVLRREQGRVAPLLPLVRSILRSDPSASYWSPGLALLLAETGDHAAARVIFDELARSEFDLPFDAMWTTVMAFLAELASILGAGEAARMLLERFDDINDPMLVVGPGVLCLGAVDRYRGMLSLAAGDVDEAEHRLENAVGLDTRGGSELWAGHSSALLADVYDLRGRRDQAQQLRRDTRTIAKRRGFAAVEGRLASRGRTRGREPSARPRIGG